MNNIRLFIIIGIISLIFIIIVLLLSKFFKSKRIVKYMPAIVSIFLSIAFFIKSRYFSTGFEDLAYIVLSVIFVVVSIVSLLTATIVDYKKWGES